MKSQTLDWSQFCQWSGGFHNQYISTAILYLSFFLFGIIINIVGGNTFLYTASRTIPFLFAGILLLSKIKSKVDIFIDILLMIVVSIVAIEGTFSGVALLYLLIFRSKNKTQIYILFLLSFISITLNAVLYDFYTPQITIQFVLYSFMGMKYYYIIHKPTAELKQSLSSAYAIIDNLRKKLEILGPVKELTDAEIIDKYRFLRYTRNDKDGNEDPYRKLHIVRMLGDGVEYKEICDKLGIKNVNTLSIMIKTICENLGELKGITIINNTHLVKVCIQYNIITIDITP